MTAEMRHMAHMLEVENKIKLLRMNWFIKNQEEADKHPDQPKPVTSVQTAKIIEEIREMRAEIKEINAKVEEYQKELNAKNLGKTTDDSHPRLQLPEINFSYMYPVPPDIKNQLFTGTYHISYVL